MMMERSLSTWALILAAAATAAQAQMRPSCARGPGVLGDSTHLYSPDTALRDVPAVLGFLHEQALVVRCITRSTMEGTAELRNVAGFQTNSGTVTVFFLPPGEKVQVTERRLSTGRFRGYYRYTFIKTAPGMRPKQYVMTSDGPSHYFHHGSWMLEVWDRPLVELFQRVLPNG